MKKIAGFIKRNILVLTLSCAALCILLSLVPGLRSGNFSSEAESLQDALQKREAVLDNFAFKALEWPEDEWIQMPDLPGDMVIYRYYADTLQSWVNQFPFANDELLSGSVYQLFRTQHYLDGQSRFRYPFLYLSGKEQYVNIGSSWYVIKSYQKDSIKVIAGLLVKTDKQVADAVGVSVVNPHFGASGGLDIQPVAFESCGREIMGSDGELLFVLVRDASYGRPEHTGPLTWIAIVLLTLLCIFFLNGRRTYWGLFLYVVGLTVLRAVSYWLGDTGSYLSGFFSPTVYADSGLFNSIGNLLLNNLYVSLLVLGFYMLRGLYLERLKITSGFRRRFGIFLLCIVPVLLAYYSNYTLRSLVANSSVNMELYRVTEIGIYTVLCYLSYALLFLMLMFCLQLLVSLLDMKRKRSLLRVRNILLYALCVSVYVLLTVTSLSSDKEAQWSRLLANRLSIERDLGLELELRDIEQRLISDPISVSLLSMPQENIQMLEMRFSELYFHSIKQKYVISMTICRPNESIQVSQMMVNCVDYFQAKMKQYDAEPIAENSSFYYLSNFNGQVGYLGVFTYLTPEGIITLYLEINSRYEEDPAGYPDRFSDYKPDELNIPKIFAYAKYYGKRLVLSHGRYDYPVFESEFDKDVVRKDGYIHRIAKVTDQVTVVISRPERSILPYIISLSYLVLFFFYFFMLVVWFKRLRIRASAALKRNRSSLGRKLNFLITVVIAVSLTSATGGSLWYSINYYKANNRLQMEDKIKVVGKALSSYFTYVQDYEDVSSSELVSVMDRLANETHADINLYDPSGKLIRSTKNDLFQRFILSSRMNPKAYADVVVGKRSQIFNREKIGAYSYYSLYSPIYNYNGKLVAIADIPYFTRGNDLNGDRSYVIATLLNVGILIFVVSLFLARALFTRLTRPISNISNKMRNVDASSAPEHINYKSNDELGLLVDSYNKMVDNVAESARKLAEAERENAWKNLAKSIAHEIKNRLTPMQLSIQRIILLKEMNSPGWEAKLDSISSSLLEQIEMLSNSAANFSTLAKLNIEEKSVFNLYDVIVEQKVLFENLDNINVSFSYTSANCMVCGGRKQISSVVVNLLSNAVQELGRTEEKGFILLTLNADGYFWKVTVEDNGNGVDGENLGKLFQANFTTKSSGNGIGLTISKEVIDSSGGKIWYSQSELGGACFSFTLPMYKGESETNTNTNTEHGTL